MRTPHANHDDPGTTLIISQAYVPDPAAVGQSLAEVGARLVRRGRHVVVLTADRGYDDPGHVYPRREQIDGVSVERLPLSSFGKRSIATRLLGAASFLAQVTWRGATMPKLSRIVVSTSPPMASFAALIIGAVRRVPISYWVMDINPDQAVLLGKIAAGSLPEYVLEAVNRAILARARTVITLDRYMAARLRSKVPSLNDSRLTVVPMWPLAELDSVAHSQNRFRSQHGLQSKRVVMYSGNHSIASPLTTLLEAALRLKDDPRLVFAFVGGGVGKAEVERFIAQHELRNTLSLPYQPLAELSHSLSAADVHVVTLGEDMVGCIHPCKVYGAMAVSRPVLFIGPSPSHVADLLSEHDVGWQCRNGDVAGAVACLLDIAEVSEEAMTRKGQQASRVIRDQFSPARLCERVCELVESSAQGEDVSERTEPARPTRRR